MDGISPEDLEAALAESDLLTSEPSLELGADDVAWQTQAQRLRGHLSTRIEFALALAAFPGGGASSQALADAQMQLQAQYAELQAAFLAAAELDPKHNESQHAEAFKISRLAAQWACRLWIWQRCRGLSIGGDFVQKVMATFQSDDVDLGNAVISYRSSAPVTSLEVISKLVETISRFDFLFKDHNILLKSCMDRIYAKAQQAISAVPHEYAKEEGYFDALVRAATDVFIAVYMQEAREFRAWLLSASEEKAAQRLHVTEIVGGLDMQPVYQRFDSTFEYALEISLQKSGLVKSVD